MRRRRFLAAAVAGLSAVAGCGARERDRTSQTAEPTPTTARPTSKPPTTTTLPPPEPAGDVFQGVDCPTFDGGADRTVCYHRTDPTEADVLLTVGSEVFSPTPDDRTVEVQTFTLHNRSSWHFHFAPYLWSIHRRTNDGWRRATPDVGAPLLFVLPPETTYTWELPAEFHPSPDRDRWMVIDPELEPGVFAFTQTGRFGRGTGETTTRTGVPPAETVGLVGLFRLDRPVHPGRPEETPGAGSNETG